MKTKSYRVPVMRKSTIKSIETMEGETIEKKVRRIVHNQEPIKDGAPEIFTERKEGVISAYNIRTDRWEIAADAMDAVSRSIEAKRDNVAKGIEEKAVKESGNKGGDITGGESVHGENGGK